MHALAYTVVVAVYVRVSPMVYNKVAKNKSVLDGPDFESRCLPPIAVSPSPRPSPLTFAHPSLPWRPSRAPLHP